MFAKCFNSALAVTKFVALPVLIEEHLTLALKNIFEVAIIVSEVQSLTTSK